MLDSLTTVDFALLGAGLLIALYLYVTRHHDHFSRKNLPYVKPVPLFGCMLPVILQKVSFMDQIVNVYKELDGHRYGGVFSFLRPVVMLRDPEVIKNICVKDFEHFMNHLNFITEKQDPLFGKNLFGLQDERWKNMRATLSPAFTSSKLRTMFSLMSETGQQLVQYVQKECEEQKLNPTKGEEGLSIEMKDLFTRFTNDVIATTAFGIKVDSLKEKDNQFYLMGKEVSNFGGIRNLLMMLCMLWPKLMEMLKVSFVHSGAKQFFLELVTNTITTREKEGIVRPDMINLLMEARKGNLKAEDEDAERNKSQENGNAGAKPKLDSIDIAAQAMIFFVAGFDTVATLLSFSSYLLATHPEVQSRLHDEVDKVFEEAKGKPTYEDVQKMKYLDMVVSECLRYFPPGAAVDRKCSKTYRLTGSDTEPDFTINKGELVWIPIYGLHHDPKYWENPSKFDPERFSDENRQKIHPFTYIPFGVGPRICIAQRFALLEAKVALTYLLEYFTLKVTPKTPIPPVLSTKGFNMTIKGGFWMGLEPRNKNHVK